MLSSDFTINASKFVQVRRADIRLCHIDPSAFTRIAKTSCALHRVEVEQIDYECCMHGRDFLIVPHFSS
jgi:hypothetical protein